MTRGRRSWAANARQLSMQMDGRWYCRSIPPPCRTATVRYRCRKPHAAASHLSSVPSPIRLIYYAAQRVADAARVAIEIVRKPPDQVGFAVYPRRWVVQRCFTWLGRNRRLAKDFEATNGSATAFLCAASAMLLLRRIARSARVQSRLLRHFCDLIAIGAGRFLDEKDRLALAMRCRPAGEPTHSASL